MNPYITAAKKVVKLVSDWTIRARRKARPLFSRIPAPLLIVIAILGLAITAEVAFAKGAKMLGAEDNGSVVKMKARMAREQRTFDLKRGTAVALSPLMFLEESELVDITAKKPMTCFLKDAGSSIRCQ